MPHRAHEHYLWQGNQPIDVSVQGSEARAMAQSSWTKPRLNVDVSAVLAQLRGDRLNASEDTEEGETEGVVYGLSSLQGFKLRWPAYLGNILNH